MASTSVVFDILARDRASDKFDNLGRSAEHSTGKMSKLGTVAKGAAKTGVLALAVGAGFAVKGLYDMTKSAIEDEAAQKKLENALKNNANATDSQVGSVEKWISAQGKALGVTDDELRPALGRLVTATKDVGKAQQLASLAMDVSAGSGKSLESVSTALMKAANGNVSSLSRLGINTKNAKGETITFEQAQKRMAATFKGAAEKNANTLSGKMQRLKVVLSEAGEEIGAKLIPVVTKMADWFLKKGIPAMEAFGKFLSEKLPPVFAYIKGVIDRFSGDSSGKLGKFISDVKGIFSDGIAIVTKLWDLFGKNIVQFLKSTFDNAKMILTGAFDIIKGIFKVVTAVLHGDWSKAWDGIKDILRGAATIIVGLVRQTFNLLRFAFKNIGTALKNIWGAMWDVIKDLADRGKDWLVSKIRAIPGFIRALAGNYKAAGQWILTKMWDIIKSLAEQGKTWLVNKIKAIPGFIRNLAGNYRDAGAWILSRFVEIVKAKANEGADFIMDKIRAIPGKIRGLVGEFKNAGGALIGAIADGIKNAGGFATDFAGQIWGAVRSAINSGIDQLNAALDFSVDVGPKTFHVSAPNIGHLARGTSNWRGGLAVVGEEGPELVNLPRGARVMSHQASMGAMRGAGGVTVNINGPVYGDPRAFAREVQRQLLALKGTTGTLGLA